MCFAHHLEEETVGRLLKRFLSSYAIEVTNEKPRYIVEDPPDVWFMLYAILEIMASILYKIDFHRNYSVHL